MRAGRVGTRPFALAILAVLLLPAVCLAERPDYYFAARGGLMFFDGDLQRLEAREGFFAEAVLGRRLHRHFALELGSGYLHDGDSENGTRSDLRAVPILASAVFLLPLGERVELSIGAGPALYFATLKHQINDNVHLANDSDVVFGGHAKLGATLDVFSCCFAGVEGKYIVTETGGFDAVRTDLDGFVALVTLGLRF